MKAKFTGHDTFPLKYGWLYKAVNHLNSGGKLQTSKEQETQDAIIRLGVGKNMVNAIRYWAESVGVLRLTRQQSTISYSVTRNGDFLFHPEIGKDPYLEVSGSIWLIHFWLCFNQHEMTSYRYFFNFFNGEYFEKKVLSTHMADYVSKNLSSEQALNESTFQKDIDTFLNTYCKKVKASTKADDEEQFTSPLSELNLIQESGKNSFLSNLDEKQDLPIEIFVHALLEFVKRQSKISKVSRVNFKSLLLDSYSPGRIFRLSEKGLGLKLDAAQSFSKEKISWIDSMGLRQIEVEQSYLNTGEEVLDGYYEDCSNG